MKNKTKLRVMIDVETLGRTPGSVVTEVGIIVWDEDWKKSYEATHYVDVSDSVLVGLTIDKDVRKWRESLGCGMTLEVGQSVERVCCALKGIFYVLRLSNDLEIWSWGNFDQGLLEGMFDAVGLDYPWHFAEWRDARTLCKTADVKRVGEFKHEALADCYQQGVALLAAYTKLGIG